MYISNYLCQKTEIDCIRERLYDKNAKFDDKTFASPELSVLSISKIKNVDTSSIDTSIM